jgi:hypothetical protein
MVDKRPEFMIYLYDNYARDMRKFEHNYNIYCVANFGITPDEMLEKYYGNENLNESELNFINNYYRYTPFLTTDCVVNRISRYMRSQVSEIKRSRKMGTNEEILHILKDNDIEIDKGKLKQLHNLYKRYKSEKRRLFHIRDMDGEQIYKTLEQYNKAIRHEAYVGISSNIRELANLALTICYEIHPGDNKTFAWNVFGEGIVQNVFKNRQKKLFVPILDEKNGTIEYLGRMYSRVEIEVEDIWQ